MSNIFSDFVERQTRVLKGKEYYEEKKTEWLKEICILYRNLTGYLSTHIKSGQIIVEKGSTHISEQLLGEYEAPTLNIGFQGNSYARIKIIPNALYVIGAWGRIDIQGPNNSAILVRVPKDSDGPRIAVPTHTEDKKSVQAGMFAEEPELEWKFAVLGNRIHYSPLTADTFKEAIMNVIGG